MIHTSFTEQSFIIFFCLIEAALVMCMVSLLFHCYRLAFRLFLPLHSCAHDCPCYSKHNIDADDKVSSSCRYPYAEVLLEKSSSIADTKNTHQYDEQQKCIYKHVISSKPEKLMYHFLEFEASVPRYHTSDGDEEEKPSLYHKFVENSIGIYLCRTKLINFDQREKE